MRKAEKIAAKAASRVLNSSPVLNKSSRDREFWTAVFLPCAEAVVSMDKALSAMEKVLDVHAARWDPEEPAHQEPRPFYDDFAESAEVKNRTTRMVQRSLRNIDTTLAGNG